MDRSPASGTFATVPPSYATVRSGGRCAYVREDAAATVQAVGFLEGTPRVDSTGTVGGGRSLHSIYALPISSDESNPSPNSRPTSVVWKKCRRGGIAAPVLGDRYFSVGRFFRELAAHETARQAGVPVSDLLAIAITRGRGGAHRVEQLIGFEEGTRDAASHLADASLTAARRRALVSAVAHTVRRFHDAGLCHGDLNLRNILVREIPTPEAILIDLDPAPPTRLDGHSASGNLLRLFRSWTRLARQRPLPLPVTDRWRFLTDYFGDPPAQREFWREAERAARRGRWLFPRSGGSP